MAAFEIVLNYYRLLNVNYRNGLWDKWMLWSDYDYIIACRI